MEKKCSWCLSTDHWTLLDRQVDRVDTYRLSVSEVYRCVNKVSYVDDSGDFPCGCEFTHYYDEEPEYDPDMK